MLPSLYLMAHTLLSTDIAKNGLNYQEIQMMLVIQCMNIFQIFWQDSKMCHLHMLVEQTK